MTLVIGIRRSPAGKRACARRHALQRSVPLTRDRAGGFALVSAVRSGRRWQFGALRRQGFKACVGMKTQRAKVAEQGARWQAGGRRSASACEPAAQPRRKAQSLAHPAGLACGGWLSSGRSK